MATEGYIRGFEYEPEVRVIQRSKDSAMLSYRKEMSQILINSVPTRSRQIRRAPGDMPLPTLEHLSAFFEELPKGAHRLSVLQMFETGMRAEEVVENTLIPGIIHERSFNKDAWCVHPEWPRQPYRLAYSMSDNRMLGVIPTKEMAWNAEARLGYQCEYRIIGKGPKIRKVHIPPKLLRAIWKYVESGRRSLEREQAIRGSQITAHAYLNRFGTKLSYHAIWEACSRANDRLRAPLNLTPHSFRHAYACYFLEAGLRAQAGKQQIDPANLPLDFIREHGDVILMTIKEDLGHAEHQTTQRYLKQIIAGRIGLKYHQVWNAFIDGVEIGDDG